MHENKPPSLCAFAARKQEQINVVYRVEFSLDGGPRTFLTEIDPYERTDGAIQRQMNVPGYTTSRSTRVNCQKRGAQAADGTWIKSFENRTSNRRVVLYATLVRATRADVQGEGRN